MEGALLAGKAVTAVENSQIADIFDEIADLLELQEGNQFRIRSYRQAARTARDLSERLADKVERAEDLTELPNIGESTAEKIREIIESGTCERLENLRQEVPEKLTELMHIPNVGPKRAMQLHRELDVNTVEELREAAEAGRVRQIEGWGEKSEQKLLEALERIEQAEKRYLYRDAEGFVESLGRHLDQCDAVKRWEVAGSFRRRKETVGDLDILIESSDRNAANEQISGYQAIEQVISRGKERSSVRLSNGLQIDFRYFEPEAFGSALMYFTGSKEHNIAVRQRAVERGWKLNEYGLFEGEDERLAGETEEGLYSKLDMAWVPPELREDRGEVEAAANGALPTLIECGDVRGDLQAHTDRTDGANTLEEMVDAARDLGYQYLAITDHSQRVTMAKGLDEDAAREQADRIREMNERYEDIWLLAGIEVDILKDGSLDLEEEVLEGLDWVLASVHYNFQQGEAEMTDRIVRALSSGVVHCFGHPTSRLIGKREGIVYDFDKVFATCRDNKVWIEINAQPDRLDLPDVRVKGALDGGVKFTISTDAHKRADLKFMRFGVNVARRGWLEKGDVLNTCTAGQLRNRLGKE